MPWVPEYSGAYYGKSLNSLRAYIWVYEMTANPNITLSLRVESSSLHIFSLCCFSELFFVLAFFALAHPPEHERSGLPRNGSLHSLKNSCYEKRNKDMDEKSAVVLCPH